MKLFWANIFELKYAAAHVLIGRCAVKGLYDSGSLDSLAAVERYSLPQFLGEPRPFNQSEEVGGGTSRLSIYMRMHLWSPAPVVTLALT